MKLHYGDMTDSSSLIKVISAVQPTEIYNLAAQSHVMVRMHTRVGNASAFRDDPCPFDLSCTTVLLPGEF